jgi:hypothetical protein
MPFPEGGAGPWVRSWATGLSFSGLFLIPLFVFPLLFYLDYSVIENPEVTCSDYL